VDSFSQAALGAAVGYLAAGRKFGRTAIGFGALAGVIPDLDSVALVLSDGWSEWRYHRGLTHGLFFGAVMGPLLGWIVWRIHARTRPFEPTGSHDALPTWIGLFFFGLITHPLLDFFTIYGTQLLAPFDNTRFAVGGLGIIDPGYTLPLLAVLIAALIRPRATLSFVLVAAGLFATCAYLFYGLSNNQKVEARARAQLVAEGVAVADVRVYTTIFQPWLRRIVVDEAQGARVGFATADQSGAIAWNCFARPDHIAISTALGTDEGKLFAWFAMGEVWPSIAAAADGSTVVRLTDRRYGVPGPTVQGWWGIEMRIGADGRVIEKPRRIDLPRGADSDAIGQLFAASRGDATPMFAHAIDALSAAEGCRQDRASR
jgi:inner membrane protein